MTTSQLQAVMVELGAHGPVWSASTGAKCVHFPRPRIGFLSVPAERIEAMKAILREEFYGS